MTAKPEPGDYDACWDSRGVDLTRIPACLLCFRDDDYPAIKAMFGGDVRIDYTSPPGSITRYLDFYMRDGRQQGRRKGIVKVLLDPKDFV